MVEILSEQTLTGASENSEGLYVYECEITLQNFVDGGEYSIAWDGTRYVCTAFESGGEILVGNINISDESVDGEPFLLAYCEDVLMIFTNAEGDTHTLAIYEKGIVLKDHAGNDVIYSGMKTIKIPTEGGGKKSFVAGELAEITVDLSMADGDMVIEADKGTVLNKVTVKKPETLIPENIAKDVNIGDVVGTFSGSGGGSGVYTITVIDYDGTVIAEEKGNSGKVFELPEPPIHSRLVFEGWSSPLDIVDGTVTIEDFDIIIGATYETASGATEIDIELNAVTGLTMTFNSKLTGYTSIDWGDGATDSTLTHTYADYGEYTIKIHGMTEIASGSSSSYIATSACILSIKNVHLANSVTSIGSYAFYKAQNLRTITAPTSVQSFGTSVFYYCYALRAFVFPDGMSGTGAYTFNLCYGLNYVVLPASLTTIGNYAFYSCRYLKLVLHKKLTTIGSDSLRACGMGGEIELPINITKIGSGALRENYDIERIVFNGNVTSIDSYAFYSCYKCAEYDFSKHTKVPTLANANAFQNIPVLAKILVPVSLYDSWIAASNWSTYANYIVAV